MRAVAAGLAGDGGGVDVAGRAGEDDGFFLFGVCFSCCFGGRSGGGGVAGAGEDVEALGGGAGVEVVEGLWGLGAESVVRGVSWELLSSGAAEEIKGLAFGVVSRLRRERVWRCVAS